jgi:hypothetical protein
MGEGTVLFVGVGKQRNNPEFNSLEFDGIKGYKLVTTQPPIVPKRRQL